MFLWMVVIQTRRASDPELKRKRIVVTARSRAEDASYRAQSSLFDPDESLVSVQLLGELPGMIETSMTHKPKLCYCIANYQMPTDPPGQTQAVRIVHDYVARLDRSLPAKLDLAVTVGPIATGPEYPPDAGQFGAILAMQATDPAEARIMLSSHVFYGAVPIENINIVRFEELTGYLTSTT